MPSLTAPPPTAREPWRRVGPPSARPNIFWSLVRGPGGRQWTFTLGVALLSLILLVLVLTPWISPHDPAIQDLGNRLAGPSAEHWLGTDHLGRDVLSRLMWGGRFSVTIAAISLVICAVSGVILGALAARRGGWLDELVMRTVDMLVCFPDVVIALFLIALFGTGYGTLIAALTIAGWTPFARLMRGLALEINAKDYVEAAEILGSPKWFILFRHVIPNALPPVTAMSFLQFGHKLITVGALSYLGLGVQPPDSDWGAMLLDAQPYMERAPWVGILAGFAIFISALSVTLIGQGLTGTKNRRTRRAATGTSPASTSASTSASRAELDEGESTVTAQLPTSSPIERTLGKGNGMSKMVQPVDIGMPTRAREPLLEIRDLRVDFPEVGRGPAIDGMDLTINRGEIVALVGESGSGKSLTALTMMCLLPPGAEATKGTALLDGEDVLAMAPKRRNEVRGNKVAMLFQQPKVMLDPTARVGGQVSEALRRHRKVSRREAKTRVVEMLRDVGIPEPARRASSYAYQLSGGMAQRVMIAAALSADPELLIADEPTTALDVTVQAQILDLLKHKRDELGLSILLITHDLGIVSTMADRVAVMYAGRIVENGTTKDIFTNPQHPYTEALLKASLLQAERGQLFSIPGSVAQARAMGQGCRFLPRCSKAVELGISEKCGCSEPTLHNCGDHDHHSRCHAAPETVEAS